MLENLEFSNKKIYFASDFHLGSPDYESSLEREKLLVRWLDEVQHDAAAIVLVGDIFDFWFEYKKVVPRGFIRLLGKIVQLTDADIPVIFFTGNHDLWMSDYIRKELNVKVYEKPQKIIINEKRLLVGHGDGLGAGDWSYKLLKKIFTNSFNKWAFARLHPNFAFRIAQYWSGMSRMNNNGTIDQFDPKTDYLYNFCNELEKKNHHDYYIFGHRHIPLEIQLNDNSTYINLGEWISNPHYASFDGNKVLLHRYQPG